MYSLWKWLKAFAKMLVLWPLRLDWGNGRDKLALFIQPRLWRDGICLDILENKSSCCKISEDVFSREHLKGGGVSMSKPHFRVPGGRTQKPGLQNLARSQLCHLPRCHIRQRCDHYLLKPHAEGLVLCWACSRCQQVLVSASIFLSFLGLLISSKGSNYQGFNESEFLWCKFLKFVICLKHQHLYLHSTSYIGYCLFTQKCLLST